MKRLLSITILLFALVFLSQNSYSQGFPYHLYDPRTLSELVKTNSGLKKNENTKNIMISAKPFYSAIRVEYAGKSRKILEDKMFLFKMWVESLGVKSDRNYSVLDVIDKEFLFKECDKEYWIPVQSFAAEDFPEDLKTGDKMTLYLMLVGGIENKEGWEIVFFANSFKVYE